MRTEPGDQVVELRDAPGEDGGVVLVRQRERRCGRRRVDESLLLPAQPPARLPAVQLEEADDFVAQPDGGRVHAPRPALFAADEVRAGGVDRGQVVDGHRLARDQRGRRFAELRHGVREAAKRRRFTGGGGSDRLQRARVAVEPQDVASDGAQFVAEPVGESEQQVLGPRCEGSRPRDALVGKPGGRLAVSAGVHEEVRRLARHELREGDVGAAEGTLRTGFDQFQHRADAALHGHRHGEDGGVTAPAQRISL